MRLTNDVALVGSGMFGFDISSRADCNIYLLDGGDELALVDAGVGGRVGSTQRILDTIRADGYDPARITRLFLTHYHFDHAGGAAELREHLGLEVHASPLAARTIETGDEEQISLPAVKRVGYLPADYHLGRCPVVGDLVQGATHRVGRLTLEVHETPGHCAGHVSFLVQGEERRYLVQGDVVFNGGTILLQNIPDCSISDYAASVAKLAALDYEAFLPGHTAFSLTDGRRHVEAANAIFQSLGVPKNVI